MRLGIDDPDRLARWGTKCLAQGEGIAADSGWASRGDARLLCLFWILGRAGSVSALVVVVS